jgi:hypothetical protein
LDSSIIQGPFSVAPCQTLIPRFATFASPYGAVAGRLHCTNCCCVEDRLLARGCALLLLLLRRRRSHGMAREGATSLAPGGRMMEHTSGVLDTVASFTEPPVSRFE